MLFVGYFEGLDSQRAIAWRCSDSLSLRAFLGILLPEAMPDHSSLTKIRQRLPLGVHEQVFTFVLGIAHEKKLLRGKTVAVDATTLEANAAMRSIVRKDTGEDWKEYLKRLMAEEGIQDPTDEEIRRFDKKRSDPEGCWRRPTGGLRVAVASSGPLMFLLRSAHSTEPDDTSEKRKCRGKIRPDQGPLPKT
jgi:transposase